MDPPPKPSTSSSSSPSTPKFPTLDILPRNSHHTFATPTKKIHTGADVPFFLTSTAYRDIGLFIMQLNRSVCPRRQHIPSSSSSSSSGGGREVARTFTLDAVSEAKLIEPVRQLRKLLGVLRDLVKEAPPETGPRRFGNVGFRTWFGLLEERVGDLLVEFVGFGEGEEGPVEELRAYLVGGFGSAQRLDYGTGHELSFLAFLGCLWKLGFFGREVKVGGEVERDIVLGVIEPYLQTVRLLIQTYTLEPAGSHGVWGLDDHSFLPYIFGSAQLTRPIYETDPMPLEGSVRGAPKTGDVVKPEVVERERECNMYFSAIGFINDVKKGPFWEHSPILFDVSGVQDGWGKINKGMIKMFNAEVLSKFPVVQHFPFGSLFAWTPDPEAAEQAQTIHLANQPPSSTSSSTSAAPSTAAPWAQATSMPHQSTGPGIPYSTRPQPQPQPPAAAARERMDTRTEAMRQRGLYPKKREEEARSCPLKGQTGTTAGQVSLTKAPWAKE